MSVYTSLPYCLLRSPGTPLATTCSSHDLRSAVEREIRPRGELSGWPRGSLSCPQAFSGSTTCSTNLDFAIAQLPIYMFIHLSTPQSRAHWAAQHRALSSEDQVMGRALRPALLGSVTCSKNFDFGILLNRPSIHPSGAGPTKLPGIKPSSLGPHPWVSCPLICPSQFCLFQVKFSWPKDFLSLFLTMVFNLATIVVCC